jgi:hypothetical protein
MEQRRDRTEGAGTDGTAAYSASKAPETRREAEEQERARDMRLLPGGRHRAEAEIGIAAMDRDELPSAAQSSGQTRYGDSPRSDEA